MMDLRWLLTFWISSLIQGTTYSDTGYDFGYDGHIGPVHWGEKYSQCTGKHQSPININILNVKDVRLPPIEFDGFSDDIDGMLVKNNGHTVQMEVINEPHPRVRGGPLNGDYKFSQMHFHWGDNDTLGSEDKINSRSFPLELHMVFYKAEYQNATHAVNFPDGLTVLAFFYELDRHGHPAYDIVTDALNSVHEPASTVRIPASFKLLSLLPYDLTRYFTYKGSLTTPPCYEVVIWIDFEQPVRLLHDQIEAFREIKSSHGKIRHNFRPVQPLGDRKVYYNSDKYYYFSENLEEQINKEGHERLKNGSDKNIPQFTFIFAMLPILIALF